MKKGEHLLRNGKARERIQKMGRCDGFLANYWDGHYCRNCLHLASFHVPNPSSSDSDSGAVPQPSTWHSFPKSWDKSRFLASLGVPALDVKKGPKPNGAKGKSDILRVSGKANGVSGDESGSLSSRLTPYGNTPLWKSDGSHRLDRRTDESRDSKANLNQTVLINPLPPETHDSGQPSVSTTQEQSEGRQIKGPEAMAEAKAAAAEKEVEQMSALTEIVTALCVQQKENEASLEEVTVVMGELERRWRAEQRENEKERRQERRHYEENMKRRDVEIMRMREELKRERCLREMAEDRVRRAEDAAKAATEDLAFIVACVKASGGNFLAPPLSSTESSEENENGDEGTGDGDGEGVDDWTTVKTFEKRPASFFPPLPLLGGGRAESPRKADSAGRVDELEDPTSQNLERENGNNSKRESEGRKNEGGSDERDGGRETGQSPRRQSLGGPSEEASSTDEKTAAATKRDEVLEQMASIYWKERREHRLTKEALEREIREQRTRIEKLEEENEKLIEKIQEIELRELAVLEKEKRMSLTPEEGERRKLEYLFEKLLSVGNMVSEITHEIQLIKK